MIGSPVGYPIGGIVSLSNGISGLLSVILDDATLTSTATLSLSGTAAVLLDDVSLNATGVLANTGNESTLLDDCVLTAVSTFTYDNITGSKTLDRLITASLANNTLITQSRTLEKQITT